MQQIRCFLGNPVKGYVTIFLALLSIISFISLGNLIMAYKTGEAINNQTTGDDSLESDLSANIFAKDFFLNLNGGMRLLLGQREMNGVVRLENGYLSELNTVVDSNVLKRNSEHLAGFKADLQERGIPLLYVLTPYKIPLDGEGIPCYMKDCTNESLDAYVKELQAVGIQPLDLRTAFNRTEANPYSLFFRTDHHWNIRGGFVAYKEMVPQIASLLNCYEVGEHILSEDEFREETYSGVHLGSYGQRTGAVFAGGADDFSLWKPLFSTRILDINSGREGTFEEIMLNMEYLSTGHDSSRYTYDRVFPLGHYKSQNIDHGKKILFVCDSMGRAVLPFLTLTFGEIYYVDAYNLQTMTEEVIDSYQPDLVLIMHYPTVAFDTQNFDFPAL